MDYAVFLHPKADKELSKINTKERERIKEALKKLVSSPEKSGERLKKSKFYRLRVGDYRAIYEIAREESRVIILFIGHRSRVYDDFSKLFD